MGSFGAGTGCPGSGFRRSAVLFVGDCVITQPKKTSNSCVFGHQDGFTLDSMAQNLGKQVALINEGVALFLASLLKDSEVNGA